MTAPAKTASADIAHIKRVFRSWSREQRQSWALSLDLDSGRLCSVRRLPTRRRNRK